MSLSDRLRRLEQAAAARGPRDPLAVARLVADAEGPKGWWSFSANANPEAIELAVTLAQMDFSTAPAGEIAVFVAGESIFPEAGPSSD